MRYIMILAIMAMLASCSTIGNVAKYTVCFGQEPEECLGSYIETIPVVIAK